MRIRDNDEKPPAFALWFREDRHRPWRILATASTEAQLTAVLAKGQSGDYIPKPTGQDPNG